jgi:hypothetical protein
VKTMKLRLLLIGGFNAAIGAILFVARGLSAPFVGLLAIGILVFVVGLLRNEIQGEDSILEA